MVRDLIIFSRNEEDKENCYNTTGATNLRKKGYVSAACELAEYY